MSNSHFDATRDIREVSGLSEGTQYQFLMTDDGQVLIDQQTTAPTNADNAVPLAGHDSIVYVTPKPGEKVYAWTPDNEISPLRIVISEA